MLSARGPGGSETARTYRSSRGQGSLAIGRLVAGEFVEVARISHLAEPGQGTESHQSLTDLAQGGVHRVLLGLGAENLGGRRERLLIDFNRRLHHRHDRCPPPPLL